MIFYHLIPIKKDIELDNEETFLFEIKFFDDWTFAENSKQSNIASNITVQNICSNCKSSKTKLFSCSCYQVKIILKLSNGLCNK